MQEMGDFSEKNVQIQFGRNGQNYADYQSAEYEEENSPE